MVAMNGFGRLPTRKGRPDVIASSLDEAIPATARVVAPPRRIKTSAPPGPLSTNSDTISSIVAEATPLLGAVEVGAGSPLGVGLVVSEPGGPHAAAMNARATNTALSSLVSSIMRVNHS